MSELNFTEEHFGILTDDGLALDATLVRPPGQADGQVLVVQAWVPKFPLTRGSVLTAARREAAAAGELSRTVNLTFDLRGSGESDGAPSDEGFKIDLHSAHEWAKERFGPKVAFRPFGFPDLGQANHLITLPLRPGVLAELYRYNPPGQSKANVLYFSRYTNFAREDDALCRAVAGDGYTVYGGDLMRYLLLAAPLSLEALWADGAILAKMLGRPLCLVARSFAAGPALIMAAGVKVISGVIVTGPAQEGLAPRHIFSQENPAHFMLSRQITKLPPRPLIFLWDRSESGHLSPDGLKSMHNLVEGPRLWGIVPQINAGILLHALGWLMSRG